MVGTLGSDGTRLVAGDGERAQLAGLDVALHDRQVGEHERDLPAQQVVDARRFAPIGDVNHLDAGVEGEQFACHVRRGADAAGAEVHRAVLGLGFRDQVIDRLDRRVGIDHRDQRRDADRRQAGQLLGGIELEFPVERRRDRERGLAADHDGVAVGGGLGDRLGGDQSAGAGTVLDHEGLARRLRGAFARSSAPATSVPPPAVKPITTLTERSGYFVCAWLGAGRDNRQRQAERDTQRCAMRSHDDPPCRAPSL